MKSPFGYAFFAPKSGNSKAGARLCFGEVKIGEHVEKAINIRSCDERIDRSHAEHPNFAL